jgi:hypothetical protein
LFFLLGIASFYLGGKRVSSEPDEFARVGRAILFAFLLELFSFNVFVNVTGFVFWMFIGLELGAFRLAQFDRSHQLAMEELKAA